MARYRKKPEIIEAEVYRPGLEDGFYANNFGSGEMIPYIKTLEYTIRISPGDYIIIGDKGERYPCKPNLFHKTYELVEGD